jgi:hypothetical protein
MDMVRKPQAKTSVIGACVIAVLSLVLLSGHGLAQERPGYDSLELRLEIGKTTLVLGEPAYATVRLINVGATLVEIFKLLDPQTGDVHIEVSSPSRPRFVFLPLMHADAVRARTPLAPGEEVAAAFPIFYGALGWTFDRPGTYRVTAGYRDSRGAPNERVRSNSVDVTVADENGVGALLLNGTSASEEAGKFLLWQRGDHLQAGQALLTDLLKTYPDSPVADYALLAFGRNLSRSFRNYAVGRIRHPDCEPALKAFQKVRSDRLPAFLQIQQHLDEARCLVKLSQPAQAGVSMKRAEQLGGDRSEFRPLFQQAVRLEPALRQTP